MKTHLIVFLTLPSLAIAPLPAFAQANPGCYIQDSNGNVISLDSLCPGPSRAPTGVFQVPIKGRMGGTPVIDVTFNGGRTFEMLLDTGATSTLILAEMARLLNIKPIDSGQFILADGSSVTLDIGQVRSIEVGGLVARNLTVGIAPPTRDAMGLLGQDVFGAYDITIKERMIEFRRR